MVKVSHYSYSFVYGLYITCISERYLDKKVYIYIQKGNGDTSRHLQTLLDNSGHLQTSLDTLKMGGSNIRISRICRDCGDPFIAQTIATKYCSGKCSKRAYKKRKRAEQVEQVVDEETKIVAQHIKNPELNEKEILSRDETCRFIGISGSTFHRMSRSGQMKTIKVGRRVFVTRKEVRRIFGL